MGFFFSLVAIAAACNTDEPRAEVEDGEWLPGGETTNSFLFGSNALGRAAENISFDHDLMFATGNSFFNQPWVEAPSSTESRDGLGPVFNARSCSACHFRDGRGSAPLSEDEDFVGLLLRLHIAQADRDFPNAPDPTYGGQLQPFSIGGVPAEGRPVVTYEELAGEYADGTPYSLRTPSYRIDDLAFGPLDEAVELSPRVAPSMTGLGLLQAIPSERLDELADPDDLDGDGISGQTRHVGVAGGDVLALGRFGWKAEQPTVRQQSAGAFLGDMGITSSLFPSDACPDVQTECNAAESGGEPELADNLLDRIEVYGMMLAPPSRQDYKADEVLLGKALFSEIGCASCHTPSHLTGDIENFPELANQLIWPYTDLLLHDMGPALSDEIKGPQTYQAEWRTPPLWGLRFYEVVNGHDQLMHDGRARGVAEAILWHGGEGDASREAFVNLSSGERDALLRFVKSL